MRMKVNGLESSGKLPPKAKSDKRLIRHLVLSSISSRAYAQTPTSAPATITQGRGAESGERTNGRCGGGVCQKAEDVPTRLIQHARPSLRTSDVTTFSRILAGARPLALSHSGLFCAGLRHRTGRIVRYRLADVPSPNG